MQVRYNPTRRTAPAWLAAALCVLAGCGLFGQPVARDAAQYYDYMLGLSPQTKYTSFYSPAYRESLPKQTIDLTDTAMGRASKKNTRQQPVNAKDVRSATLGIFALTAASDQPLSALGSLGTTRWVRDGGRWYLYFGSDAEIKAYGEFPPQLQLPAPTAGKGPGAAGDDAQ
jgi:hypothetical protein